mgnify:FL=1
MWVMNGATINRIFAVSVFYVAIWMFYPAQIVTAQGERVADPNWVTPRTVDGQPDLQGLWGNKTITPTERPDSAQGSAFLNDEEMAAAGRQRSE